MSGGQLVSIHKSMPAPLLGARDRVTLKRKYTPTPETPIIISASELRDFLRCRVKHNWRHRLQLVPKEGAPALAMGSLVHGILEAWYGLAPARRTTKTMSKMARIAVRATTPKELSLDDLKLIEAMCVGYAAWAPEQDEIIGLVKCNPEEWFEEPLNEEGTILVRGKIDNVFEPSNLKKTLGCLEFKTKGQIRMDVVEMNLQLSVYLWALRRKYPKFKRYIAHYRVLRKQMPGPRVKADLFASEAVERTDNEIDQWAADTARSALDILDGAIYPNPMDACSFDCDFRIPCLLRGNDSDLKHVLKTEYKTKESYK